MAAYLITAEAEHDCEYRHCPKGRKIAAGEAAVKANARRSSCGGSYSETVYYHEDCYQMKGGKANGKRR